MPTSGTARGPTGRATATTPGTSGWRRTTATAGTRTRTPAGPHPFAVEDPGFNALLTASEWALAQIASAIGADPAPHARRAEELTRALLGDLWAADAGLFLCRDVRTGALERELSVAGLLPLVVPGLPRRVTERLVATAAGGHFGLGVATALVPSYDLAGPAFDPRGYWRGPAWTNTDWLLERGLRQHGHRESADRLRACVIDTAYASGFAEYVDPRTRRGHGTRGFSWTAALALDLHQSAARCAATA